MLFSRLKKVIIKIDSKREHIEDFISYHVLEKWDSFEKVEDLRYAANLAMINFVLAFAETQGLPAEQVPQNVREKIAKATTKVEKKLNKTLQKQLTKKSKLYQKNNKGNN